MPGGAKPVTVVGANDQTAIRAGQQVVVMGYPEIAPDQIGIQVSRDIFNQRVTSRSIADPSTSTGLISKMNVSQSAVRGVDRVVNNSGEVYQLGINETVAGNSGGPVFDMKGRVMAIFYAKKITERRVSLAIPISYGMELMSSSPGTK